MKTAARFPTLLAIALLLGRAVPVWPDAGRAAARPLPTQPRAVAHAAAPQAATASALADLRGLDELKTMFNRDAGTPRLVLLLSPT